MKRGASVSLLGGIAVIAWLLIAPGASAATLVGDYQFQGTDASSGPALTEVGAGGPTSFQTDTVMGMTRQVLAFPEGTGLSMTPSVGSGDVPYSVVTTFRFTNLDSYRRILDASDGSADQGFYVSDGTADIFGIASEGHTVATVFTSNTYATVAVTSSSSAESHFYVNGALDVVLGESFPVSDDTLRFFKDDGGEDSAGAVSCIRVYNGVLTDAEVAGIGASPTCSAPAPAPAAAVVTCHGTPATIVGTNANDMLKGTPHRDVIAGLGGNDKLSGLAGNDLICGGLGKDTLKGGKGNDKLFGEAGKDTLNGGPGQDKLAGGKGKDKQIQ